MTLEQVLQRRTAGGSSQRHAGRSSRCERPLNDLPPSSFSADKVNDFPLEIVPWLGGEELSSIFLRRDSSVQHNLRSSLNDEAQSRVRFGSWYVRLSYGTIVM